MNSIQPVSAREEIIIIPTYPAPGPESDVL
jgi:hypothetical protein